MKNEKAFFKTGASSADAAYVRLELQSERGLTSDASGCLTSTIFLAKHLI
jgi:hypothetical protein